MTRLAISKSFFKTEFCKWNECYTLACISFYITYLSQHSQCLMVTWDSVAVEVVLRLGDVKSPWSKGVIAISLRWAPVSL